MFRLPIAALIAVLVAASAGLPAQQPQADRDWWKHWLEDVGPLLQPDEVTSAKAAPASGREAFRETFWRRRNPMLRAR